MELKNNDYISLIVDIWTIISNSKEKVTTSINTVLIETYWNIWKYIVEYEQKWKERAEYWKSLLKNLSKDLAEKYWKWYSERNLKYCRNFYNSFKNLNSQKRQSLIAKLSWTHIVRLLSVRNENERSFYIIETSENNWSVRELDRQINSLFYERLALSKDKNWVIELSKKWQIIENKEDLLKDPYVLEFLWLWEHSSYSESDLETAIINNLEKFLLELWKWFSFVWRQERFSAWSDHFYVDLVFYNRLLKCFVLIDLKIWKITHQDLWQMQMYVNYYDREIKKDFENKTIWILLCKEKNDLVVEYTLPVWENNIVAKEYNLYLPKKEDFKKQLEKLL